MKYKKINIITGVIFLVLFAILGGITYKTPFEISEPQVMEGWVQQVSWKDWTYTGVHEIDSRMCGSSISFLTNNAYVDASIDGKKIYHFGKEPRFGKSPGTYQHFIHIPEDAQGKQICVKATFCEKSKICNSYAYLLGDSASIVVYLLGKDVVTYIVCILMIIFSLVFFVLHILGKKDSNENNQNVWLGALVLIFCLWSSTRSFISQLLFSNSLLQYYLSYYFLFLIPLCLLNYIEALFPNIKTKIEYICNLIIIAICVCGHFLNIWTFSNSSKVFAAVMFASMLSMFIKVGYLFYKDRNISLISISLMVFLFCFVLNAVNYFIEMENGEKLYIIQFGLLVYVVVALVYGARKIIVKAEESKAAEVYKEMAYTDNLTKLQNRRALRKNVETMQLKDLCVVSMDLNNLKYYNDNLGHIYGDKLIREAARIIQEVYKDCYRTGGDEFVAILQRVTREQAETYRSQLSRSCKKFTDSQDELVLEIASGNGYYNEGDQSYEDIMKRADENMYYDKAYIKKNSKIKSVR